MKHTHGGGQPTGPSAESLARGFETTDAAPGGLLVFTISLTITLAVVICITLGLFYMFNNEVDRSTDKEFTTSPLWTQRSPSPAPPLQPSKGHETFEYQDTAAFLADYDRLSHSYGSDVMADHAAHDRMPVDAAMLLMGQDGLASVPPATDVPVPQGVGNSMATPYSPGGRGDVTGTGAAPGVPQH
jgi:hypothetical protein